MSDAPAPRSGRSGGIFVAVVVAGSAVAVVGWYMATNRGGAAIDASGFDLSVAPESRRPAPAAAPSAPAPQMVSSLGMMKADAGVRIGESGSGASAPAGASAAGSGDKTSQAHMGFIEAARKHEGEVQNFAVRMTKKHPVIRRYGKEWMSYPDLRKLNDDYARNHDPIAFMAGLAKAPHLGEMVKKYAGDPAMREFIIEGMKQAPGELTTAALDVLQNDRVMKDLVANIVGGMGLPPSITAMISGGSPEKIDQNKMMGDMMNDPQMKKAMQQAPPVSLPNQP
jgi:hypothetical protein